MKKIFIAAIAIVLPALASAQVQLLSGYNFGQFLGDGPPVLDASTYASATSVGSNFRLNSQAPNSSSGDFVAANSLSGDYSNGFGRIFWDGTHGSSSYENTVGTEIKSTEFGANAVNGATVQGYSLAFQGDGLFQALTTNANGNRLAFAQNTTGYSDYDPLAFVNGPGVTSDSNLTFAASVTAPVTISWFFGDLVTPFATTNLSGSNMASYSVDLPTGFYGLSEAVLLGQFSGAATLDNVAFNGVFAAIPEPSTYAAILGVCTMGFAIIRRRKNASVAV